MSTVTYEWRGPVSDPELAAAHAAAFGGAADSAPWGERLERHSLGWVTARIEGALVGFVNVVGDGGVHGFVVDTLVDPGHQRQGIGRSLLAEAVLGSRAAGAEWLHVDFESRHAAFYRDCGFAPTAAGLLRL